MAQQQEQMDQQCNEELLGREHAPDREDSMMLNGVVAGSAGNIVWPLYVILRVLYSFLGPFFEREYGNIPEYRGCLAKKGQYSGIYIGYF